MDTHQYRDVATHVYLPPPPPPTHTHACVHARAFPFGFYKETEKT